MRVLSFFLFFNRQFMGAYVTTIGRRMWVPVNWELWCDETRERILRHEAVHLRQQRRYGFLLYAFLYLFVPLPLGLAWFRAKLEWEAYSETLRGIAEEKGVGYLRDPGTTSVFLRYFTTGAYGWMWPFPRQVYRWYEKLLDEIQRGS